MSEKPDSVQNLIEDFLTQNKHKVVFSHKKGYRTYAVTSDQLSEKISKLRVFFKNKNIKKGDKIILLGSNYIWWISVYFASILSGIIVVPLDILTDKGLLKRINNQVNAKTIFQDKGLASLKIKTYYLDELEEFLKDTGVIAPPRTEVKKYDILEIMYTSGTTGLPKGVIMAHENIIAGINSAISSVPLRIKLKILNLLPLSHIFGQIFGLFLPMYFSQNIFFIDTIQPRKIISFIKNKQINGVILVPGILDALKKDLGGISIVLNLGLQFRLIGVGGAPLDIELEKWWKRRFIKIIQGYGLTETSSIIATNNIFAAKTGSVGRIAEGVEIKFGDDNEILVKGNNVTHGYYKDNEKTKNSFEDGWFKTGDIGEIKDGYLHLKERKKDVIITGSGLKAYPIDIEAILNKIDVVKESCVIEKDKKIHAVLILSKKADISEIIKDANAKLLTHQKISNYSIWPQTDFPKTPIGKIKKYIVKQEIVKLHGKSYTYGDKLFDLINNVLKSHQKITINSKLTDLGMDSLKRVELISKIENEFGVEIDEIKLNHNAKVYDLRNLMKESNIYRVKFMAWPLNPITELVIFIFQKAFYYLFIRTFTKTYYYGLDNIKGIRAPVIFASNHQSAWDGAVIIKKTGLKTAIAAGSDIVFGIGTKSFMLKAYRKFTGYYTALFYNTYPFGMTIGTDASLEFTGEMLDRGYSIVIFPEGERTADGKIHRFKSGIGYLALHMNAPIVPIKIEGLFYALPRAHIIPKFGKSAVKFGKPIKIKDISYIEATKLIEKKVREL